MTGQPFTLLVDIPLKPGRADEFMALLNDVFEAMKVEETFVSAPDRSRHVLTAKTCFRSRNLAGATGLEPAASCVTGRRSNQLNYAPAYYVVSFPPIPSRSLLCQLAVP